MTRRVIASLLVVGVLLAGGAILWFDRMSVRVAEETARATAAIPLLLEGLLPQDVVPVPTGSHVLYQGQAVAVIVGEVPEFRLGHDQFRERLYVAERTVNASATPWSRFTGSISLRDSSAITIELLSQEVLAQHPLEARLFLLPDSIFIGLVRQVDSLKTAGAFGRDTM